MENESKQSNLKRKFSQTSLNDTLLVKINSVKKKRCLDLTHVEKPAKQLELLQQALETRVDWLKYKIKRSACNYYLHQKGTSTLDVSAENNVVVKQFDGRSDFVELICSNTTTVGKSFERSNSFTRKVSSISFLNDRTKRDNFIKIMDNLNTMSLEPSARHIMENKIINRLSMLKSKGLLSTSRIPRCIEPLQKQTTEQDLLLEQMHWYFTDIISDRKLRLSTYKKINNSVIKHFNTLEKQKMIQEKEAIVHRKKLASAVSKEILIFWKNIHKVLRYKQKLITKTEQQEALNEHLHILIDQSRQYISTLANNNRLHDENLFDTNINNANLTSPDISSVANFKQPIVLVDIPILIKHTLREYQHVGLDWLSRLYKAKLNGILADEMGLGKTIQTIAFLAHLACAKGIWGPFLIIVPTSVMLNWELEFKKWCPAFKILTYYGTAKERKDKRKGWTTLNAFHVCVTSYMLACRDALVFRRVKWKMLVLDEAQNIKNFKSQRWQSLLSFNASRRLLLTGTPLQNSVMELWSFMHFLMPKFFTSHDEFNLWFSTPLMNMIEGNTSINEELISQFHQILRPFILRRLKSEVEKQMPKKFEHIITAKLSKRQRCLYDEFIHSAITQETIRSGHYVSVIGVLMQLRKVCNHPDLFEPRSITSPFATVPISYHVPKEVVNCLNFSIPTAHSSIGFCSAEFNQSSFDCLRARVLAVNRSWYEDIALSADTNSDLLRQHIQPITNFKDFAIFEYLANHELRQNDVDLHLENLNSIKLPGSPLIKGNDSMNLIEEIVIRRKQRILDRIESFSRTQCLKSLRSLFKPIYGKDLIELVSFISHNLYIDQSAFDDIELNRYYLNLLNVVADIIENGEAQRLIDSFHLYVPTVIATPISLISSAATNNVESNINIRVSLPYNLPLIQFPDRQFIQHDSGKLRVLRVLLQRLQRDQHRVVMFSQMTRMLDILETFLSSNSMTYLRLDGSTKIEKRQVLVKTFNQDKRIFCFILSTRSGGIGINLTGADTVIFYDSDWNPTSDAQAQDRCHRIGQTRDVHIYRLVSEFTVEENILKKATQKRILGNVAIDGLSTNTLYKKQSIKELFDLPDIITTSSEDILNNDSVPYKTDSTPEDKQFVQALELVEDESDVHALKSARDEAALEELEFRDDDVDNLNDKTDVISIAQDAEIEVCKRKLEFLNQELSSIEKFALKYAENHQDMFTLSRTQLNQMTKVDNIRKECELSKLRSVNIPNIEKDIDSLSNNSEDIEQQLSIESALRKEKVWTVFVPELNTYVEIQPYGDFNDIINNTYAGNYVVSDIKSLYEYPEDFAYLLDTVDPVYYDEDDHSDKDCDSFEVENDNSNGEISDLDKNTNGALQKCIKPPAKFRQRMPSYRSSRKATKAVSQLKELVYKYSSHRRSATKANQQSVKLSEYEMENMHKASKFLVRVKRSRQLANVHGLSEFMNNNSYESYCGTRRWKRWYASDDIRRCKETRSLCLVTVKLDSPIVLKESLVSDEVKCQQSNSHTSFTLNASLLAQKPLTNSTSKNKVYRSSFSKTTAHNQGILWGSLLRNFKDKPKRTRNVNQKAQGQPRPDSIQASVLTKATNLMLSPSPTQSNSMRFPSHNEIQINQTGIQGSLDQNHQNMVDSNPQYKYQLTQSNSQNQQDHQQHLYIQVSKAYQPLHISHRTNDGNGYDQQQVRSMNVRPDNSLSDQQQRFVIPTALYPMERATDIDESHSDKVIPIQHNISHAPQTRIMQPPSTKQTYFQKFRAHINQLTPDNLGFAVRPIQSLPNSIRPLINQQTYTTSTECSQSNHTDPVRSSSYPSLIPTTSVSPIISDQFRSHESKSISQALQQNQLSSAVPHLTSRSKYSDILQMSALQLKAATDRQQIQQQNQQQILNAVNSNAQLINISSHNITEQIKHKLSTRSPSIPTRQISADQRNNQTHNYQDLQPRFQQRPQISTQLAYDAFRTSSQPMQRTLSNFSLFNEKSSDHVPKMSMSTTHYLPNKSSDISHSVASVYNDSPIYNTATTRLPSIETLKRPRLSDTYNSKTSFSLPSCPQPVQSAQSYRYVTVQNRNLPSGRLHLNAAASSRNLRPQQRTKALSHRIQNFGVNFRPVSLTFAHESDGTQPLPSMSATSTGIRSFRSSSSNLPYNCVSNSGCQPLVQSIVSKASLPPGHRSQLPRLKQLNNNARNLTEHFIKQHYPYRLPPATKEDKQI